VRIEVRFKDEVSILSLSGRFLAGGDGPFLRQKVKDLIDAGTTKLLLDFSEVPYIDSTGLGFLAAARITAQNARVAMVLANLNPHVRRVLDDVKLSQFFEIAENEAAALTRFREGIQPPGEPQESEGKARKGKKRAPPASES
jgi:anti-sigma B factor antagonist